MASFAIYSETDFSLNFYDRSTVPAVGDIFEDKTVTAIYTSISASTPAWKSDGNIAKITNSTVVDVVSPTSCANWYNGATLLTSLNLTNLDTSNVTDVNYMFGSCNRLENIDVSNFNTSNITNMRCMFYNCGNLTSIDVSNFDVSSVTNFEYVFYNCLQANIIGVDTWDVSSGTSMQSMFYKCASTPLLDLSNWDTSNVTNMSWMFNRGAGILNLQGWDTSKVTNFKAMFSASYFTYLDLSSFDVSAGTDFNSMFFAAHSLKTILVSYNWNETMISTAITDWMFEECDTLMGDIAYSDMHAAADPGTTEHMEGGYATTENGYLTLKYNGEDDPNDSDYNKIYLVNGNTLHDLANGIRGLLGTPQKIALKNFSKILQKQVSTVESATLIFKDRVHNITDDVGTVGHIYFTDINMNLQDININKFYLLPTIIKGSVVVLTNLINLSENTQIIYSGEISRIEDSLSFIIQGDATIEIIPN